MADFDYTLSPEQLLTDLINAQNRYQVSHDSVTYGVPQPVDSNLIPRNTTILIKAIPGGRYHGQRPVYYNRVALADFVTAQTRLVFVRGEATRLADLITQVNEVLGINLTVDDYEDGDVPSEDGDVLLKVKPGSLVYLGELMLTVVTEDLKDLAAVIYDEVMEGLVYDGPFLMAA